MRFFTFFLQRPFLAVSTLLVAGCFGIVAGSYIALQSSLPPVTGLKEYRAHAVTRILDRNGKELAELFQEKRIWIPRSRLPQHLVDAILADGDERFLAGDGVRYGALLSALFIDLRKGTLMQGGDTISGQVARQFLPHEERTAIRKVRETLLAMAIERAYTKDEILEIYCNTVSLGKRARGFEAAARVYFDKSIGELTLSEVALLTGLIRTPERDAILEQPTLALQRRDTILSRMAEMGSVTRVEEQTARREPLRMAGKEDTGPFALVVALVRDYLIETYGEERVFRQGLTVTTTIDRESQRAASMALTTGLEELRQRIIRKRIYSDEVVPHGLLISLKPGEGEIVALTAIGHGTATPQAILRPRRDGGALIPFIYLAALESGYTLADRLMDEPTDFTIPDRPEPWRPVNQNGRYQGSVTVREALSRRLTTPSVRLLEKIGIDHAIGTMRRFGVSGPLPHDVTLAAGEAPVSPMELVSAYGGVANGGYRVAPGFIRHVVTAEGEVLEEREPTPIEAGKKAPSFVLTRALEEAASEGVAKRGATLGRPVAAMAGESDESKEVCYIGYTPSLVTAVWLGLDRDRSLGPGETGDSAAGPLWKDFMIRALDRAPRSDFLPPQEVIVTNIDPVSGTLSSEACGASVAEVFVKGTEPREYCRPASPPSPD